MFVQDFVTAVRIIADDARGMSAADKQALHDLATEHEFALTQLGAARTLLAELKAENEAQRERLVELQKVKPAWLLFDNQCAMTMNHTSSNAIASWQMFPFRVKYV